MAMAYVNIRDTFTFTNCTGVKQTIMANDILSFNSGYQYTGRISGIYGDVGGDIKDKKIRIWWTANYGNNEFLISELFTEKQIKNHNITKTSTIIPHPTSGLDTTDGMRCSLESIIA